MCIGGRGILRITGVCLFDTWNSIQITWVNSTNCSRAIQLIRTSGARWWWRIKLNVYSFTQLFIHRTLFFSSFRSRCQLRRNPNDWVRYAYRCLKFAFLLNTIYRHRHTSGTENVFSPIKRCICINSCRMSNAHYFELFRKNKKKRKISSISLRQFKHSGVCVYTRVLSLSPKNKRT